MDHMADTIFPPVKTVFVARHNCSLMRSAKE